MIQKYTFFLYTPTISPPLTLYCSDEYYPSKPQLEESLISRHSLPSPYLSLPLHPLVFPRLCHYFSCSRSLSVPFFPYLIFLPLTYVDLILSLVIMILGSASVAGLLKPGSSSSSSNAPFFSSAFKQPHKMASVLHVASCI